MSIEKSMSSGSKSEAISMAIAIIEQELYAQILASGLDPETFDHTTPLSLEDLEPIPANLAQAEWVAYTTIPRLIDKRLALVAKLEEINNAGT
jgi:hypothetical protein